MRSLTQISILGAAGIAAASLLVAVPALAGHGKVGLWNMTNKMDMPGMQMPDMSKLPPEVQARIKAMHMSTNGGGIKMQHCMTQAEVDQNKPPMQNKECKLVSSKVEGRTYSGDVACTGQFNGTGHMQVTYDSDEHYSGSMDMKGTHDGQPMNMHSTFEGQWVSASCGNVTN
ncbi:MAG TPA: DUF3617 domain-containing protein [Rhizomicrobium sp.]|jgi:hypothetical protein|nr:DUF3617 domain-containing protein [Rhizomicrobium sp.]